MIIPQNDINVPTFNRLLHGRGPGTNEARDAELTDLEKKIIEECLDIALAHADSKPDPETKAIMFRLFASGFLAGLNTGSKFWIERIKIANEGLTN